MWHPVYAFIFPDYFALIFPACPCRAASQWLRPFPGFIKSFFMAACFVFLFFGTRWLFYSTNSLKPKGLLAGAVEWKGMPVLFFCCFSCRILILCHYCERAIMFLYSILTFFSFKWAPRAESRLSSAWGPIHRVTLGASKRPLYPSPCQQDESVGSWFLARLPARMLSSSMVWMGSWRLWLRLKFSHYPHASDWDSFVYF